MHRMVETSRGQRHIGFETLKEGIEEHGDKEQVRE
jgi:hypothetical protein